MSDINVVINTKSTDSYFDGTLLQWIGWNLLSGLISACTFGLCAPWGLCLVYKWETAHTVVNGHRLKFNGTGAQLWGNWIKWFLLTIITFGIYGFWLNIKLKQWIVKHTEFAD
ncbi:MAG: DUF898 family protein [Lachnospiraceae bacterium]|nr:DUF898 family protein [Lachnospiraceae bacterium]